jgi:tetratricopeptide (TPR) repeat protein
MRAEMHLRLEQPGAAQADLIEALRQDPHDAQSFALLARVLIARDHVETALDVAQRAVALAPDRPEYRRLLAHVLRASGRRDEAAAQLGRALGAGGPADWWAELAGDYEALDLLDHAKDAWRQAIALAPEDATAHYRYSCLLERFEELPEAIASLRAALERQPGLAPAHARLAELFAASTSGRLSARAIAIGMDRPSAAAEDWLPISYDEALESARRAVALAPDQSDNWYILGALLRSQGVLDEAAHALQRAYELDPSNAQAAFWRASPTSCAPRRPGRSRRSTTRAPRLPKPSSLSRRARAGGTSLGLLSSCLGATTRRSPRSTAPWQPARSRPRRAATPRPAS